MGTTVAPWQLFFQQSNVIDKRITPRYIGYERADTTMGAFVVVGGAAAIIVVAGIVLIPGAPLALLKPVQWSAGTKLGMLVLRAYLITSVLLLIIKAVQIGRG